MALSASLLSRLGEFIAGRMGLYFPEERWNDLERGLASAAKEFSFDDVGACADWLISTKLTNAQIETLASHFTVGETYFFRDKACFDVLAEHVLPELIEVRRKAGKYLRVWSAGCCTGEEPYSIAILLKRIIRDLKDWNITILATDLNPAFLRKASAGVYGEWSFRDTPKWVREGYFKETKGKRFELFPEIRKQVIFAYHNLAEDSYPSLLNNTNAMDLIFCRNVLMYFTPDHQKYVVNKLSQCLVDKGWLIVSPSEASHALFSGFLNVNLQGTTLYKKGSGGRGQGFELTINNQQLSISSEGPPECPVETDGMGQKIEPIIYQESSIAADVQASFITSAGDQGPQSSTALYEEALSLYENGAYNKAAENLAQLLSENSHEGKSAALLARIAANQGRLSEALKLCERAVSADRCEPANYYLLATILQEQGSMPEAVVELRKALYLDHEFVLAHFLLGTFAQRQGNKSESLKHFRNALSILERQRPEDLISRAEGLTAGRLSAIIRSSVAEEIS